MKQFAKYKGNCSISYTDNGDPNGFPILIQHGLIASIDDFGLFDRLTECGTRLISIARPGYGASNPYIMKNFAEWADIVAVVVDELELSQFDVFGISSGAPYSYSIGNKFHDKVRNIFILSGIPALYDKQVLSLWPYAMKKDATMAEMEERAIELFFSNLPEEDLLKGDIKDSMMNNCFGVAQDLRLQSMDWGFSLSAVTAIVYMRHSKADDEVSAITAEMTAKLLPKCHFELSENDVHFSKEVLDDFIMTEMSGHYFK